MAGDWIKIEHVTPDKPEVFRIAEILGIDPDAVVGKLLKFWIWADQQAVRGDSLGISETVIDRITHQPGFSVALREVAWLQVRSGSLAIPRFDRHNGQTAKARAESARRMAKSRDARKAQPPENGCCANVAEFPQQKPQPEKSEREKKDSPPLSPPCRGGAGRPGANGEEWEELGAIMVRVNGLRDEWAMPAAWTRAEVAALRGSVAAMRGLAEADWALLRRFLRARVPEGSAFWQPHNRQKFVETFADVCGSAQRWERGQRRAVPVRTNGTNGTASAGETVDPGEVREFFRKLQPGN